MDNFESILVCNHNLYEFLTFYDTPKICCWKKDLKIEMFNYLYIICSITVVDFHPIPSICSNVNFFPLGKFMDERSEIILYSTTNRNEM